MPGLHGGLLRNLPVVFCGLLAILICAARKQPKKALRLSIVGISLVLGSIGCGGGSGSGSAVVRQPTNATITVTATSGKHIASNLEKVTILH
jgi:hypothetical protein